MRYDTISLPPCLSFFTVRYVRALQVTARSNRGSQAHWKTSAFKGFFIAFGWLGWEFLVEHAWWMRDACSWATHIQWRIKREALTPVLICRRARSAALQPLWQENKAGVICSRCLFSLLFFSDPRQLFLLPLPTCLPSDEWHRWCVKRHFTADFKWLSAPLLSVKSLQKRSWQCCCLLLCTLAVFF